MGTQEKFSLEILQAVSDWQRGGDKKQNLRRGMTLKAQCRTLPDDYRICSLCCFRQIALPKGGVWNLIGEDRLPEKISSWTINIEVAKEFKGGVPPEGQDFQGVILCVKPNPRRVIVNLGELYKDLEFNEAMNRNKLAIKGYSDGAGRYGSVQNEVVLEIDSVTEQDLYSLGGHSSPFEHLVDIAAEEIYGRSPTEEERNVLLLRSEHIRAKAGPTWLNPQATQRVLERIKPKARKLADLKSHQNRDRR
jgi:hypothetical protein